MKLLLIVSSVLFAQFTFAHEVSFHLYQSFNKADVSSKCKKIDKELSERIAIEMPHASFRTEVTSEKYFLGDFDYRDMYTCDAIINNIPGELTVKKVVASENKHERDVVSCEQDSDLVKKTHSHWLAVVENFSRRIVGKSKCKVEILEVVGTEVH